MDIDHDRHPQPYIVAKADFCGKEADMDNREVLLPPTLRATLTVEGAERLRQILEDESKPGAEGKEMPTADPSVLLEKVS